MYISDDNDNATPDINNSSSKGLFKPPTKDEVQSMKETGELFKSNLFRLQVSFDVLYLCIYTNVQTCID